MSPLQEIINAVTDFSAKLDHEDSMAVLVVLSHGETECIYGVDGNTVEINLLKRLLDERNCKLMENKPKLVVIQACQGGE